MQIFFPPKWLMITLFFVVWPLMQAGISLLSNKITDDKFRETSWMYRAHKWEDGGKIYDRIFKIRMWKGLLPDGAAVFDKGFKKKKLVTLDKDYLGSFIKETCRAEWAHWMQIIPFWVFALWAPFHVIYFMLAYALIVNLPCIMAQRYNRPRLKALLNSLEEKEAGERN